MLQILLKTMINIPYLVKKPLFFLVFGLFFKITSKINSLEISIKKYFFVSEIVRELQQFEFVKCIFFFLNIQINIRLLI
jgi:hypothetical protein